MVLDVMASECHRTLKKCVLGGVLSSVHQLEKFPEVRQNERKREFIRVGDVVETGGWLNVKS